MALALFSVLVIATVAGVVAVARALANSQIGDDRQFLEWREELVEMLDAHLANIDSLMHGFSRRRT